MFRDFNFAMDPGAAARVVSMDLATTFLPYEAARRIEITEVDLDRLAAAGGAPAWVAQRARAWLGYWHEDIGRRGFYPFDLLAAAYVVEADLFVCARVYTWVGEDPTGFIPFWSPPALLVGQDRTRIEDARAIGSALYCPRVDAGLGGRLRAWLGMAKVAQTARRRGPPPSRSPGAGALRGKASALRARAR